MNIIAGGTKSLLYISGLPPAKYWQHAIEHKVHLQNRSALPGQCIPYKMSKGTQPNVGNLRIFGCEAMAFAEKDQRTNGKTKLISVSTLAYHQYAPMTLTNSYISVPTKLSMGERCFVLMNVPSQQDKNNLTY
jgi:hypothetical protein